MNKIATVVTLVCLAAGISFGDVWQDLAKYKYGNGNAVNEAEQLLHKTPVSQHGAIEDSLIAVVTAKDATPDGKEFACRMLQQIGTAKCIPAVAGLLHDEVLSDYARLVLERMIDPKADEAMRAAFGGASDKVKIGIIGSLGVRRDIKAVKPLVDLTTHGDPAVASAAISALGRIGGTTAAKYLGKLKPAESLKPVHMTALLDCASSLKGSAARKLYDLVLEGKTSHRIGALSGMLAVDEKRAVSLMVDFVKGDDPLMSDGVLTLVCGEKSESLTKAMAELLGKLPDEKKAALIAALGARGDKSALAGLAGCLTSTNETVRNAAIMASSQIGDAGTVKILLGLTGGSREAIARMPGSGVNAALLAALEDKKLKAPAIRALVARNCTEVTPSLYRLVNDGDPELRRLAWDSLNSIATKEDIAGLAKAAFAIKDEGELSRAVAVTRNVCSRTGDKAKNFEVFLPFYDKASDKSKMAIIELVSVIGSPAALEIVKSAIKSGNKDMHGAAVRSLSAWCNNSAAGDLLELAKNAPEPVDRILALRGYIRLAGSSPDLSTDQRGEMFKRSAELATRADEKKMIAGTLQNAGNAATLTIVNTYLDDPAVRDDAELSALNIVEHLRKKGPADKVKEVATKLLASKNQRTAEKARAVIENIGK